MFVPTSPWLRVLKPFHSVDVGTVDDFHFQDFPHLEGKAVSPIGIVLNHLRRQPGVDCVSVSTGFLRELGFDVPDSVITPKDIIQWSLT